MIAIGSTGNYQMLTAPIVMVKRAWEDDWQFHPEITVDGVQAATASEGGARAELSRPYGWIKWPWASDMATVTRINLDDWYVAIGAAYAGVYQLIFAGRVKASGREVWGADAGDAGVQHWTVLGGESLLNLITVSQSDWWEPDRAVVARVGWLPTVNDRDVRGDVTGNRSTAKHVIDGGDNVYLFGGVETWNHLQFLEYLLAAHLNLGDGPRWKLGGQIGLLAAKTQPLSFGDAESVADILGQVISPADGLDYLVLPSNDHWEIRVFSINTGTWSFYGATLPKNPRRVAAMTGTDAGTAEVRVATDGTLAVRRIRVLGERILVCCSLFESDAKDTWDYSLRENWTSTLQTEYEGGDPDTPQNPWSNAPYFNDRYRQLERFRPVFQYFTASPNVTQPWRRNQTGAAPACGPNGELADVQNTHDYQQWVCSTEDWIPLKRGWDYSEYPAVADGEGDASEAEYRPVSAWVKNNPAVTGILGREYLSVAESEGAEVRPAKKALGIELGVPYNHAMALGVWEPNEGSTNLPPLVDYRTLVATVAFRSDQRLALEAATADDYDPAGGLLEIVVPGAEMWVLAPETVVGIDASDGTHKTSGEETVVLRNDADRLLHKMAGAMARYWTGRNRATIRYVGFLPVGGLVGSVLGLVQNGADLASIEAPITRVAWTFPRSDRETPTTTIYTGFAE